MNVVLDTNVLVSAILSPGRKAYSILQSVFSGDFQLVFDARIMDEYENVLHYRKFRFDENDIADVMSPINIDTRSCVNSVHCGFRYLIVFA